LTTDRLQRRVYPFGRRPGRNRHRVFLKGVRWLWFFVGRVVNLALPMVPQTRRYFAPAAVSADSGQ
jgi:hypothetical protein